MRKLTLFAIAAATIIFSGLALISDRPVSAQRIKPNPPVVSSSCVSPPAGLVAWWPGDGNANDIVGLNDGTLQGGATATGSGYVGSQAFSLSGTAQFVQVPDAPAIDVPTAVSLDAWVFATDLNKPIFAKAEGTDNWNSYGLWLTSGQLHFEVTNKNASSYGAWRTDAAILANTWYHVAATWENLHGNSTDAKLYLNGVEQTSVMTADLGYGPSFTLNYTNLPLVIGTDQAQTSFFNGLIDEVEIFNRVISSAEVASIYKAGNAGKCKPMCTPAPTGMIASWGGDGDAHDISGHGNNGTLQNGGGYAVGKVGQAFSFSGVNQFADVGDVALPSTFTIEGWINPSSLGSGNMILAKDDGASGRSYFFIVEAPGKLAASVFNGADFTQYRTNDTVAATATWQHIVVTYDGSAGADQKMKFYVDGVNQAAVHLATYDSGGTPLSVATSAKIGIFGDGTSSAFVGLIDELSVYDRILSDTEIRAIYRADVAGKCKHTCAPAPTNMVSWWDGDGNANDIHGTNNGTMTAGATFATGVVGQGFRFDGSSGSAIVPDSTDLDLTTDFTLEAWINPAALQGDPQGGIISKVGGPDGNKGYQFGITGSNTQIYCQFNAAGEPWPTNQLVAVLGSPIPIGAWSHVACSYDHANLTIYLNGSSVGSLPIGPKSVANSTSNLRISGDDNNNVFFNGRIDEPAVFNRALTLPEIQSIYNAGYAGLCKRVCAPEPANMVSWWPGDGDANDIRGTNNGIPQGAVAFAAGEVNQAFVLNGTNAYVEVPDNANLYPGLGSFTADAWIKTTPTAAIQEILAHYECALNCSGAGGSDYELYVTPAGKLGGVLRDSTNVLQVLTGTTTVADGAWHHVALVRDVATPLMLLYVDGAVDVSATLTVTGDIKDDDFEADPLAIGAYIQSGSLGPAAFFNGSIDEVEYFNGALSQTEIQSIYDAGSTGKCRTAPNRTFHIGDATLTFGNINKLGSFGVHPIAPGSIGQLPPGYNFLNPNSMAYDITTTADYTGPIDICFHLPYITDPAALKQMTILHGVVTGTTTDWEEASPRAYNPATNSLCGRFNTLSPFAIVQGLTPTAAGAKISGFVTRSDGSPLGGVSMQLSGGRALQTITRSDGSYAFADLDTGNFYTVTPALANFTFSPRDRAFSLGGDQTNVGFTAIPNILATANPLDMEMFFVRQQYLDFLGREPDANGLAFWTRQLSECGGDAACVHQRRIDVSAAFFASDEFRQTGSFIYRLYKAALGRQPTYAEFSSDRPQIVVGADLEASKDAFADGFMERAEFTRNFPSDLKPEAFIDSLITQVREASGVDLGAEAESLMKAYETGASTNESRCHVMLAIIEDSIFQQAEYNQSFVLMQYFGYLHRDPDRAGYSFWLDVLNNRVPGNYRAMVCAFITSAEYQLRFGSVVTHTNAECGG